MFDDTKMWKLQVYAERAWRLSMDIAIESAKLPQNGGGLAVVADETRCIANKLYMKLEQIKDGRIINDDFSNILEQLNLLILNGLIELIRLNECVSKNWDGISVSIILDEIRMLVCDLMELFKYKKIEPIEAVELSCYSSVTDMRLFLLQVRIGGNVFVENIRYIQQIIRFTSNDKTIFDFKDNTINLKGIKVPVVDLYNQFRLTKTSFAANSSTNYALIVNTDWDQPNKLFAVLVDDIMSISIFKTKFGVSSPCRSAVFYPEFIRECWDADNDQQMLFVDWRNI